MCGIGGVSSKKISLITQKKILKMNKYLAHRGPDDEGYFKSANKIIMIHTRLAIIDIEGGVQPIENSDYTLTANGEIYNDIEIRKENKKYKYQTGSDSESIISVYNNFGIDGFKKLRGMFAFALFDKKKEELIIGRDPFGIKPIYFCINDGSFIYSSEPQAIVKSKLFKPIIDENRVKELLQLQFCSGRETIFKGIYRLRPGEVLIIKDGKISESHIVNKTKSLKKNIINDDDILEKLKESVSLHQRSDVPYGLFFSGGIDSTIVLYLMSLINTSVNSYSIIFPGQENEKKNIEGLCKKFKSSINFIEFNENDFWELIPQTAKFFDDPVIDYAILPTFKLAREAKKDLKVILTGEGGDELFGGYGRYRSSMRKFFFKKRSFHKGIFSKIEELSHYFTGWNYSIEEVRSKINNLEFSELQKVQLLDFQEWLPNDLLIKLDRCLMAHGLEGRTPLIDTKLFSNFFLFPDNKKINKGLGKYFIRDFLNNKIPFYDSFKKKSGFTVPLKLWLPKMCVELSRVLPKMECLKNIFPSEKIKDLCLSMKYNENAIIPVWRLTFYALWFIANMENKNVDGNTIDVLNENI
jgi:asparagine synthase (glutamine-hydrolysing)